MEGEHVVRLLGLLGLLEGQAILRSHMSTDDFTKSIEVAYRPRFSDM